MNVPVQAEQLARLEARLATLDDPGALIALATEIDDLGRRLALEIVQLGDASAPLRPVLFRVPVVHTHALLRAAEKLDDAGSPRRAARVLLEALRKAIDANLVESAATALAFTLDAAGQREASARVMALVTPDPAASRREWRARYLTTIDELAETIGWAALDDDLGTE